MRINTDKIQIETAPTEVDRIIDPIMDEVYNYSRQKDFEGRVESATKIRMALEDLATKSLENKYIGPIG